MNNQVFVLLNAFIALLLTYIAFGNHLAKFLRFVRNFLTHYYDGREIAKQIISWYDLVDDIDEKPSVEQQKKIDKIEDEINFHFKAFGLEKKIIFRADNKFQNRFLSFCGIAKKHRSKATYLKFAHVKNVNLELSLQLTENSHQKHYTLFNFPLSFYWLIISANHRIWRTQYHKNWEAIDENEKVIYSDVEMPIKAIRLYYKI